MVMGLTLKSLVQEGFGAIGMKQVRFGLSPGWSEAQSGIPLSTRR
jgi:hypothetical protein